ncbi:hypothetical protein KY311_00770 [Candidatus Woesearchaeota archaeon]|nr:hypothetical protein [Candidatus Woesearchaeota archaeon]MBW3017315.1 hypothetical protein [Candidatus Woesearchaeota archaeon]
MPKKCMICGKEAHYLIKATGDAYCKDCAQECFSDLSFLHQVEEEAEALMNFVESREN